VTRSFAFPGVGQLVDFLKKDSMIAFNRRTNIFMCKKPTSMMAGYDSIFARAKLVLKKDPFSGHLFLFLNEDEQAASVCITTGLVCLPLLVPIAA
jgi:hypothetical protein